MNLKIALALSLCLACVQDTRPDYIPENFGKIVIGAPVLTGALAYVAWAPGGQWARDLPTTLKQGFDNNPRTWTVAFTTLLAASLMYEYRKNKNRIDQANQKIVKYLEDNNPALLVDGKINPQEIDAIYNAIFRVTSAVANKTGIPPKDLKLWHEYQKSGYFSSVGTLLSQ